MLLPPAAALALALAQAPAANEVERRVDPSTLGPRVGEALPVFRAPDQAGRLRDFASLKGPNGLVLVFFRSADW
jgi:hypothetical protein